MKRLHLARDLMGQLLILYGYRFHNCKTRDLIRILYNIDNITKYIAGFSTEALRKARAPTLHRYVQTTLIRFLAMNDNVNQKLVF